MPAPISPGFSKPIDSIGTTLPPSDLCRGSSQLSCRCTAQTGKRDGAISHFVSADGRNWSGELFGGFVAVLVTVPIASSLQAYANA